MGRIGQRGLLGLLIVALALGLAACRPGSADPAGLPAQLNAALSNADRAGFDLVLGGVGDQQRDELWTNLGQLGEVSFAVVDDQTWRVGWRLAGEQGLAWHFVGVQVNCKTRCQVAEFGQARGQPAPLWAVQSVQVHQLGPIRIIGDPSAAGWLQTAQQGLARVQASVPSGLLQLPALLVIEAPADRSRLEAVLAAPATDFAQTGALSWQADSARPADATTPTLTRIVINPETTATLTDADRALLLAHEGVHLATGWLGPPVTGRKWVAEGLAEAIALPLSADEQDRSWSHLAQRCRLDEPPDDAEFSHPGAVLGAYAWSGWAVGQLLSRPDAADQLQQLWSDATHPLPELQPPAGVCG